MRIGVLIREVSEAILLKDTDIEARSHIKPMQTTGPMMHHNSESQDLNCFMLPQPSALSWSHQPESQTGL
jgi:hypothetical protein